MVYTVDDDVSDSMSIPDDGDPGDVIYSDNPSSNDGNDDPVDWNADYPDE